MFKKIFSLILISIIINGCYYYHKFTYNKNNRIEDLHYRASKMKPIILKNWGNGGLEVFNIAVKALESGYKEGKYPLVTIEDLWVEALQEGKTLFNKPHNIKWGATTAQKTGDMLNQTTVGPWQMTVWNIRDNYGSKYGLSKNSSALKVIKWCQEHPIFQARMIADYIENAYEKYGKRSPYAIQSYFWLEAYVKGEIGQNPKWWVSPVVKPKKGKKLTKEDIKNTGFYAKQIISGHPHQPYGLLFWLALNGKISEIDEIIETWAKTPKYIWSNKKNKAIPTKINGIFKLKPSDLKFWPPEYDNLKLLVINEMNKIYNEGGVK